MNLCKHLEKVSIMRVSYINVLLKREVKYQHKDNPPPFLHFILRFYINFIFLFNWNSRYKIFTQQKNLNFHLAVKVRIVIHKILLFNWFLQSNTGKVFDHKSLACTYATHHSHVVSQKSKSQNQECLASEIIPSSIINGTIILKIFKNKKKNWNLSPKLPKMKTMYLHLLAQLLQ